MELKTWLNSSARLKLPVNSLIKFHFVRCELFWIERWLLDVASKRISIGFSSSRYKHFYVYIICSKSVAKKWIVHLNKSALTHADYSLMCAYE
jgi:hypothetical protein